MIRKKRNILLFGLAAILATGCSATGGTPETEASSMAASASRSEGSVTPTDDADTAESGTETRQEENTEGDKEDKTDAQEEHVHEYVHCICECGRTIPEDGEYIILSQEMVRDMGYDSQEYVDIPETVSYDGKEYKVSGIGTCAFRSCDRLISVTIPDTVTYIGNYAFDECGNVQEILLGSNTEWIGTAAFQCCYKLQSADLPGSVRHIGNFAYNHCSSLRNGTIQLPESLETLGSDPSAPAHMFYNCGQDGVFTAFRIDGDNKYYKTEDGILYTKDGTTLVSIPKGKTFEGNTYVMPDTVTNLGELSFSRNGNLECVVISDSLDVSPEMTPVQLSTYLNRGNDLSIACYGYTTIKSYEVKETNPRYCSVDGILYSRDRSTLIAIPSQYTGELVIPEGTVTWQEQALWTEVEYFRDIALNKITSVSVPASMSYIDEGQIEAVNKMVDFYGTKVSVSDGNTKYTVDGSGHLASL